MVWISYTRQHAGEWESYMKEKLNTELNKTNLDIRNKTYNNTRNTRSNVC